MASETYCTATAHEHQQRCDALSASGWRPISISVYGGSAEPRYAAIWVQRDGPAWRAVHGVDAAGYQSFFDQQTATGFVPVLVSATGAGAEARFAAVFEQGIGGPWLARHEMIAGPAANPGTFENHNRVARAQGMILRSASVYGTAAERRFAAVWHPNPGKTKWHAYPSEPEGTYQAVFDLETSLPGVALAGYRPAFVTLSDDRLYCACFRDDAVGTTIARHGLDRAELEAEIGGQSAAGLEPICLQGGGVGAGARFAVIFGQRDLPQPRVWTATGSEVLELTGFDRIMQGFMVENGVRAAQLAIGKAGTLRLSRAYTWAEPGYRRTQPTDPFLLASCSKMFLAAAVQSLYDSGELTPVTKAYPLLGLSEPLDPRSDEITVQQLLDHGGGYDNTATGSGFDATYAMRRIALESGLTEPASRADVVGYMYYRHRLDFDPGTNYRYSNYGYLLASAIVEQVTGRDYFEYLSREILQPRGIAEILVSSTSAAGRPVEQAIAEDGNVGPSALDLASSAPIPFVYGGDGMVKEVAVGSAGLACSAQAMVRFIRNHAVWGKGPRAPGGRTGSTPGASAVAVSRGDDVDWAITVNTREWADGGSAYNRLIGGGSEVGSINNLLSRTTFP